MAKSIGSKSGTGAPVPMPTAGLQRPTYQGSTGGTPDWIKQLMAQQQAMRMARQSPATMQAQVATNALRQPPQQQSAQQQAAQQQAAALAAAQAAAQAAALRQQPALYNYDYSQWNREIA